LLVVFVSKLLWQTLLVLSQNRSPNTLPSSRALFLMRNFSTESGQPDLRRIVAVAFDVTSTEVLSQGVYKFNQANFQEIPGGIFRKIQDMFALLWPPM